MKYKIYKLSFKCGIHIGSGLISSAENTLHADTIFSAMCIETLGIGGVDMLESLVDCAREDKLRISDALPYIGDVMYLPKPMCRIERDDSDMSKRKEFKKMTYIPCEEMNEYLSGKLDPTPVNQSLSGLGHRATYQKVSLNRSGDNDLYNVGIYEFNENCGLYIIVGFENEKIEKTVDKIFDGLQYSGLGGKRKSGYGRFSFKTEPISGLTEQGLNDPGDKYMTLSVSMANDNELELVLDGAAYTLIKRSGFVQSVTYSDTPLKKRDFYAFAPGAVFTKRFLGNVFDVSKGGVHAVYRYLKPMLLAI